MYYVNCPILNDEAKSEADPVAKVIASRQYADWRELRFELFTSPQVGKMVAKMATQIVEALERANTMGLAARVLAGLPLQHASNSDPVPDSTRETGAEQTSDVVIAQCTRRKYRRGLSMHFIAAITRL